MITMTGKYQTRDGRAVRVLCVDRKAYSNESVMALISERGGENIYAFHSDGHFYPLGDSELDLIPAPTKHEGWVTLHVGNAPEPLPVGPVYITKEGAAAGRDRNHTIDNLGGFPTRRMIIAHVTWED